jgi:Zn-finger nucleic acid-binding protein
MSESQRVCPRCGAGLKKATNPLMAVDVCTGCGGVFFEQGELAKLARKHHEAFPKLEALVKEPAKAVSDSGKLTCPGCGAAMERYEYAYCSGIMLDHCPTCGGIWADEGELGRIGEHLDRGDKVVREDADRATAPLGTEHGLSQHTHRAWALAGMVCRTTWPERWL